MIDHPILAEFLMTTKWACERLVVQMVHVCVIVEVSLVREAPLLTFSIQTDIGFSSPRDEII